MSQASNRQPNATRLRQTPSCRVPRSGEPYNSLSCLPPNGFRRFTRVPNKLEGNAHSFRLDSGAAKSIVNLQAFPNPHSRGVEDDIWDVILGADFLRKTKAVLNFAEGTFTTQQYKETNFVVFPPQKDAQLVYITDSERKELHSLLSKYLNIFSWQGAKLGRVNVVKHAIHTGEVRSIWQPPRRIPQPLLEEVNRLVEELIKDEVIKPSKPPLALRIALVKKSGDSLRLCIDYRKLNAVTKKIPFPSHHINDSLDFLHGSKWFTTLHLKSG
ncbi:Transposon Ty3-I Gag-Pol polyprotein [Taenia solium]|eukprot:TsM_001190000 transcript=TsM_001190000 gene=TsM_001190000